MGGEDLAWRQRALLWSMAWFLAVFLFVLSLATSLG
jgi:hypothetical protein